MPSNFQNEDGPIKAYGQVTELWGVWPHAGGARLLLPETMKADLSRAGYEFYQPVCWEMGRPYVGGRQVSKVEPVGVPLIPNYLFARKVRISATDITRIGKICGQRLGVVHPSEMARLMRAEELEHQKFHAKTDTKRPEIELDAEVEIEVYGSLWRAIVTARRDQRVTVLMEIFGRATPMEMPLAQVLRATRSPAQVAAGNKKSAKRR